MSRYTFKQKDNPNNIVAYGYDFPLSGYFVDVIAIQKNGHEKYICEHGTNLNLSGLDSKNIRSRGQIIELLKEFGCNNESHLQQIALDLPF